MKASNPVPSFGALFLIGCACVVSLADNVTKEIILFNGKDRQWKDKLDFRGPHEVEKPAGEWNHIECLCDGNHIQVILNGTPVNEAFGVSPGLPAATKFCCNAKDAEIFFRGMGLRPVKTVASPRRRNGE
jgi:hypothetical protein